MIATWADAIPDWAVYAVLGFPFLLVAIAFFALCLALRGQSKDDKGE